MSTFPLTTPHSPILGDPVLQLNHPHDIATAAAGGHVTHLLLIPEDQRNRRLAIQYRQQCNAFLGLPWKSTCICNLPATFDALVAALVNHHRGHSAQVTQLLNLAPERVGGGGVPLQTAYDITLAHIVLDTFAHITDPAFAPTPSNLQRRSLPSCKGLELHKLNDVEKLLHESFQSMEPQPGGRPVSPDTNAKLKPTHAEDNQPSSPINLNGQQNDPQPPENDGQRHVTAYRFLFEHTNSANSVKHAMLAAAIYLDRLLAGHLSWSPNEVKQKAEVLIGHKPPSHLCKNSAVPLQAMLTISPLVIYSAHGITTLKCNRDHFYRMYVLSGNSPTPIQKLEHALLSSLLTISQSPDPANFFDRGISSTSIVFQANRPWPPYQLMADAAGKIEDEQHAISPFSIEAAKAKRAKKESKPEVPIPSQPKFLRAPQTSSSTRLPLVSASSLAPKSPTALGLQSDSAADSVRGALGDRREGSYSVVKGDAAATGHPPAFADPRSSRIHLGSNQLSGGAEEPHAAQPAASATAPSRPHIPSLGLLAASGDDSSSGATAPVPLPSQTPTVPAVPASSQAFSSATNSRLPAAPPPTTPIGPNAHNGYSAKPWDEFEAWLVDEILADDHPSQASPPLSPLSLRSPSPSASTASGTHDSGTQERSSLTPAPASSQPPKSPTALGLQSDSAADSVRGALGDRREGSYSVVKGDAAATGHPPAFADPRSSRIHLGSNQLSGGAEEPHAAQPAASATAPSLPRMVQHAVPHAAPRAASARALSRPPTPEQPPPPGLQTAGDSSSGGTVERTAGHDGASKAGAPATGARLPIPMRPVSVPPPGTHLGSDDNIIGPAAPQAAKKTRSASVGPIYSDIATAHVLGDSAAAGQRMLLTIPPYRPASPRQRLLPGSPLSQPPSRPASPIESSQSRSPKPAEVKTSGKRKAPPVDAENSLPSKNKKSAKASPPAPTRQSTRIKAPPPNPTPPTKPTPVTKPSVLRTSTKKTRILKDFPFPEQEVQIPGKRLMESLPVYEKPPPLDVTLWSSTGPGPEAYETNFPNPRRQDLFVQILRAIEANLTESKLPLHIAAPERSQFRVISTQDLRMMPIQQVQEIFATQHIIETGLTTSNTEWSEEALELNLTALDKPIVVHDNSEVDVDEDGRLRDPNALQYKTTLRRLFEHSQSESGRVLNGLDFPLPTMMRSAGPLDSHIAACKATYDTEYHMRSQDSFNIEDFSWGLCGMAGCSHPIHFDAEGLGTYLDPLCGRKLWAVMQQKDGKPFADPVDVLAFDPYKVPKDVLVEAVVLRPGERLYMRPNTAHYVYTLDHSICIGGHFYSFSTIRQSVYGLFNSFTHSTSITNTIHTAAFSSLRKMLIWAFNHYSTAPFASLARPTDPTTHLNRHLPTLDGSEESLLDLTCLIVFNLLAEALHPHSYATAKEEAETIRFRVARDVAEKLINWISSRYSFKSSQTKEELSFLDDIVTPWKHDMMSALCQALLPPRTKTGPNAGERGTRQPKDRADPASGVPVNDTLETIRQYFAALDPEWEEQEEDKRYDWRGDPFSVTLKTRATIVVDDFIEPRNNQQVVDDSAVPQPQPGKGSKAHKRKRNATKRPQARRQKRRTLASDGKDSEDAEDKDDDDGLDLESEDET